MLATFWVLHDEWIGYSAPLKCDVDAHVSISREFRDKAWFIEWHAKEDA